MTRKLRWAGLLGVLVLAVGFVGCVDGDGGAENAEGIGSGSDAESAADPARTIVVTLGDPHEFAIGLSASTISEGDVTFEVTNGGALPHQFVIVQHEGNPASLPVAQTNVDTTQVEVLGESGDLDPGASATVTLDLESGSYVIFSNMGGHYGAGMFTPFVVE